MRYVLLCDKLLCGHVFIKQGGMVLMRIPVVAGNWKMYLTEDKAGSLAADLIKRVNDCENIEIILCPSFTNMDRIVAECRGTNIKVGAQNMHWEDEGAFTGEVSPLMLRDLGCDYVILGHSERRQLFGETDENVNRKVKAALKHNLRPILCVGETLGQCEAGIRDKVCREQLEKGFGNV